MSELNGYKFSGVYSNTFADDTFGVLLGVVYAEAQGSHRRRRQRRRLDAQSGSERRELAVGQCLGRQHRPQRQRRAGSEDEYGLIGPGQFRVGSILEEKKRRAYSAQARVASERRREASWLDGLKTRLDSPQVGYQQSYYPLFAPGRWSDMTVQNGIVTGFTMDNPDPRDCGSIPSC